MLRDREGMLKKQIDPSYHPAKNDETRSPIRNKQETQGLTLQSRQMHNKAELKKGKSRQAAGTYKGKSQQDKPKLMLQKTDQKKHQEKDRTVGKTELHARCEWENLRRTSGAKSGNFGGWKDGWRPAEEANKIEDKKGKGAGHGTEAEDVIILMPPLSKQFGENKIAGQVEPQFGSQQDIPVKASQKAGEGPKKSINVSRGEVKPQTRPAPVAKDRGVPSY